MSLRVQYASDIHLVNEGVSFSSLLKPCGNVLILAGDIGDPKTNVMKKFLKWCSNRWECVLFVPGNGEYYGETYESGNLILETLCREQGIKLLSNNVCVFERVKVVVLGTTLWSHIPINRTCDVRIAINEFQCIKDWTIEKRNKIHKISKAWLKEQIAHYSNYKIIVVTHHAPLRRITSAPVYRNKPSNCAFSSDCSEIMEGVDLWIFGHTHYCTTFKLNRTVITSNPFGRENESLKYCSEKYFDFHS